MKKLISVRIENSSIEKAKKIAKKQDRSRSYLYDKWIKEGIKREEKKK